MGKFKRAGDGMRVEMCCCPCCGYTYFFFFACDNKRDRCGDLAGASNFSNVVYYMANKVTPERSRWTRMFVDNLYSSAPLTAALYTKEILLTATTRTSSQQWPKEASLAKLSGKKAEDAKGTLKQFRPTAGGAELPPGAENVLAVAYYDQGPVHMLTSGHDKARVLKVSRQCHFSLV